LAVAIAEAVTRPQARTSPGSTAVVASPRRKVPDGRLRQCTKDSAPFRRQGLPFVTYSRSPPGSRGLDSC